MNDRNPIVATDGRHDYRLVELLGPEPGGERYAAEAEGRDGVEPVSIRTFNDGLAVDARFRDRLLEAVKLHRELSHPSINPVRSLIELHHAPAVVEGPLDGKRLSELLGRGPLPLRAAAAMGEQLASALKALHAAGVGGLRPLGRTHQDLHPGNVMLRHDGQAVLLEVGIARARLALDRPDVRSQEPHPSFASPERRAGQDRAESDVYSLGLVLISALTGRVDEPLPEAQADHTLQVALRVGGIPDIPEAISILLREMLAFDANDRPASREVARRLRALTPDLSGPWLSAWTGERVPAPPPVRSAQPGPVFEEAVGERPAEAPAAKKAPKTNKVEALRPLRKTTAEDRIRQTRVRAALIAVGTALLAIAGAVGVALILKPEWVTRWWVDNHGPMDMEDVPTDLPGPSAAQTGPQVVVVSDGAPAQDGTPGGSGEAAVAEAGAAVRVIDGPPAEVAELGDADPEDDAAPAAAPPAAAASTNPEEEDAAPRITRRRISRPPSGAEAGPDFGADFERVPDDAPRFTFELTSPLAEQIDVVCANGLSSRGIHQLRMEGVPQGRCDVRAMLAGSPATGSFDLDGDKKVECRLEFADRLRCW